jgi:hypothetical protein
MRPVPSVMGWAVRRCVALGIPADRYALAPYAPLCPDIWRAIIVLSVAFGQDGRLLARGD